MTVAGVEPKTVNSELLVISRGLEEVEWWSVYALGTGRHLFDTYSAPARVVREALITCDSPKLARLLRSYAETTRTLTVDINSRITLSLSPSHTVIIPIAKDDLDVARATVSAGLHVTVWKR